MKSLLLTPHTDDETLFCSWTIMRERPTVLVVFDSEVQVLRGFADCDAVTRRQETLDAIQELTGVVSASPSAASPGVPVKFLGLSDRGSYSPRTIADAIKRTVTLEAFDTIYAPAFEEGGHEQHNQVNIAAALLVDELHVGGKDTELVRYTTYVRGQAKTRTDKPVPIDNPEWITRKHRALACYKSQLRPELGCQPWFTGDLAEYYL